MSQPHPQPAGAASSPALDLDGDCRLALRGWTGEFLQAREVAPGDYRLWHPDGSYFGRLVPDGLHTDEVASGIVYGPTGVYVAEAIAGRLRVNTLRRRSRMTVEGYAEDAYASPGSLAAVERRWPRRG